MQVCLRGALKFEKTIKILSTQYQKHGKIYFLTFCPNYQKSTELKSR